LELEILCLTYFLTSLTMLDSKISDMRQIWYMFQRFIWPQIRSYIEYLIQTYYILVLIF